MSDLSSAISQYSACPLSSNQRITHTGSRRSGSCAFCPAFVAVVVVRVLFLVYSASRHETINYTNALIKNHFRSFKTNIYAHAQGRLPTDRARYFIFIAQVRCVGDPYTKRKTNFIRKPTPFLQTSSLCISLKKTKI